MRVNCFIDSSATKLVLAKQQREKFTTEFSASAACRNAPRHLVVKSSAGERTNLGRRFLGDNSVASWTRRIRARAY